VSGGRDWFGLDGRVVLVTGSSGGIGAEVAGTLAAAGALVVGCDVTASGCPGTAWHITCDLSRPESARDAVAAVEAREGRLDALVHAAGIRRDGVVWKLSESDWSSVMRVNLDAAFHLLRHAVPVMRRGGGGSVVLVASINGERGKFGQSNYAASKAGLIALARSAARETGRFHIRVNAVAPGMIATAMTKDLPEEFLKEAVAESALGRLGEPSDVAQAILFLCSRMSGHITGQVLRVDGGQLTA
jgi:NAD(P)-dependent dehydrogenase (short-subunit alcohol dehydrogenase family)